MGWEFIIYAVVFSLLSYALAPKPGGQQKPTAKDAEVPIAEEGVEIPVLFGTRDLGGANVVWYGDVKTIPIKSKGGKK